MPIRTSQRCNDITAMAGVTPLLRLTFYKLCFWNEVLIENRTVVCFHHSSLQQLSNRETIFCISHKPRCKRWLRPGTPLYRQKDDKQIIFFPPIIRFVPNITGTKQAANSRSFYQHACNNTFHAVFVYLDMKSVPRTEALCREQPKC